MTHINARQAFAKRFEQALQESGLNNLPQYELGKLFDVSAQAVRKWLNAEALPNSSRAPEVAKTLQVRRAWLIDGELPMRDISISLSENAPLYSTEFSLSSQELTMISDYRKLSAPVQKSISQLLINILNCS